MAKQVSSGGTFLQAKELTGALALLVEGKSIERGVPNRFKPGETRDVLTLDLTIFKTQDELQGKVDPEVMTNARIGSGGIVREWEKSLPAPDGDGESRICKLVSVPSKTPGFQPGTYPRPVDDSIFDLVAAWEEKRNAAIEDAKPAYLR